MSSVKRRLINLIYAGWIRPQGAGEDVASGGIVDISWNAVPEAATFDLYYTLNGTTYLKLAGGQGVSGDT